MWGRHEECGVGMRGVGQHGVSGEIRRGGVDLSTELPALVSAMALSEDNVSSFEMELESFLEQIQHGANMAKKAVQRGAKWYWVGVRSCNQYRSQKQWCNVSMGTPWSEVHTRVH